MPIQYPDLFNEHGEPDENERRFSLYCAVCYLLHRYSPATDVTPLVEVSDEADLQPPGAPIPVDIRVTPRAFAAASLSQDLRAQLLTAYGGMLSLNMADPALGRAEVSGSGHDVSLLASRGRSDGLREVPITRLHIVPWFIQTFTRMVQLYSTDPRLPSAVLRFLESHGEVPLGPAGADSLSSVFAEQLARVVKKLIEQGIRFNTPQLHLHIKRSIDATVVTPDAHPDHVALHLQDLID